MNNKQLLTDLLAQPGKVRKTHASALLDMLAQYPYAQPIHLLLAKADAEFVPKAALYSNGNVLYNILQEAEVEDEIVVEEIEQQQKIEDAETTAAKVLPEIETFEAEYIELEEEPEVFEEIGEVQTIAKPITEASVATQIAEEEFQTEIKDEDYIESVVSSDFFAFEKKLSTDVVAIAPDIETVIPDEPENSYLSKYDDDKMPYTFLWWLAKTRKEHEQIFQPYAQPSAAVVKQPEVKPQQQAAFQQQYVEHIFHIQTPFEVADHLAEYPSAEVKDVKGAEIIERFLKEDPTIKAPKPEQIDNENKAKKSAEDHYDLVSETLAKIYIEQMLYHKAIDTYKKLSLKYPEKSGYFADLIQSIEKKL
ncbi:MULTISPECIES: hypothetical protein [unclassified Pedobacter]|uniref:hypothetical protein n=1 Tax=unclassified Pedobacter TaxID=2628915 RepID=UPI001E4DE55B|nr:MULTISPECIES: hypothetical protein [unclassified Pedobacter]